MKPDLKIYYDNQLDIKATYAPVLKRKLIDLGLGLSDKMVSLYSK